MIFCRFGDDFRALNSTQTWWNPPRNSTHDFRWSKEGGFLILRKFVFDTYPSAFRHHSRAWMIMTGLFFRGKLLVSRKACLVGGFRHPSKKDLRSRQMGTAISFQFWGQLFQQSEWNHQRMMHSFCSGFGGGVLLLINVPKLFNDFPPLEKKLVLHFHNSLSPQHFLPVRSMSM